MTDIPSLPAYGFEPTLGGLLSFAVAVILPLIAGLLMKEDWGTGTKGVILLVLAAIKAVIDAKVQALHDPNVVFHIIPVIYTVACNFIIAVAAYFGLWKDTPIQQLAIRSGVTGPRSLPRRHVRAHTNGQNRRPRG